MYKFINTMAGFNYAILAFIFLWQIGVSIKIKTPLLASNLIFRGRTLIGMLPDALGKAGNMKICISSSIQYYQKISGIAVFDTQLSCNSTQYPMPLVKDKIDASNIQYALRLSSSTSCSSSKSISYHQYPIRLDIFNQSSLPMRASEILFQQRIYRRSHHVAFLLSFSFICKKLFWR